MRARTLGWLRRFADLSVAQRRVRICTDDERLATQMVADARAYCLEIANDQAHLRADAVVNIHRNRQAPLWPTDDDSLAVMELAYGECRTDQNRFFMRFGDVQIDSGASADYPVELYAALQPFAEQREDLNVAFVHAVHAALRRAGCFALHSAGLIEPVQGQGVLIIGASGAGKTTLTMRLAEQGWQYLSDDYHLLGRQGADVGAWPWRRVFTVTEQTLAACASPQLVAATGERLTQDPNKRCVLPSRLFPDADAAQTIPRHLIFNHISGEAESRLLPMDQSTALTKLIRQSPWSCYDPFTHGEHLALLTALTRQCNTWQLVLGTDWLAAPEKAAANLSHQMMQAASATV